MVPQPLPPPAIKYSAPSFLSKAAAALTAALAATALAGALFSLGFSMLYLGRILPGVRVAGVDLSGLSHSAAIEVLSLQLTYPLTGRVVLSHADRSWTFAPAQLGMHLDAK